MDNRTRAALLLAAVMLVPAAALEAQATTGRLQPTAASEPAKMAFRTAMFEAQNLGTERARKQLVAALAADPQFGLAQVYQTVLADGITPAERESRIAPALGAMGKASPAEVLLALYWRETSAGRGAAAVPIIKAATELVPEDAEIAYIYLNTQQVGKSAAEQVALQKRFLERFPTHAAAYNQLAYTSWRVGDGAGALDAVQQYAKHAPDHPNSHDSYADILLLVGRADEAAAHVARQVELDPEFAIGDTKLGTIQLTVGDVRGARSHFATALTHARTPGQRIQARHWQAASHVYARDARAAVRELNAIAEIATAANMPGAVALAFDRAAVIDAYIGNRKAVAGHLAAAAAAATTDAQKSTYQVHAAIALSRSGMAEAARTAAAQFAKLTPDSGFGPTLDAILALDRKDYAAAESALAKVTDSDPLVKSLRAELMVRQGRKAEGQALKQDVLSSSVKMDGNPPVEFLYVIARMRASSL